ncbi:CAP domain-containing protein [Thiohalorhabdus sp.]|uniref:CAP domain-containing protein n=1 Tax=Thiohalorhabdus sp. TaxID=3094134 RepID=UPI002FC30972
MRVHKRFIGNKAAAARLWPFARKKLAEVEDFIRQSGTGAFTKTVSLANGFIRLQVVGGDAHVTIHQEGELEDTWGVLVTPRVGPLKWWDWVITEEIETGEPVDYPEYLERRFHPYIPHPGYKQPGRLLESGNIGGEEVVSTERAPQPVQIGLYVPDAVPIGMAALLQFFPNKRQINLGNDQKDPEVDPFLDRNPNPLIGKEEWRSDDGIVLSYDGRISRRWSGWNNTTGFDSWARVYYRGDVLAEFPGPCNCVATTRRTRDDGGVEHWLVAGIEKPYADETGDNAMEIWARRIEPRRESAIERRVRELANAKRIEVGLSPIYFPPGTVSNPAREYANSMIDSGVFEHGPYLSILQEIGAIAYAEENLTMTENGQDPFEAFENWMNSPPDRASILASDVERMNFSMYVGVSDNPDHKGRYYWVMHIVRWTWFWPQGYEPQPGVHDRGRWKKLGSQLPKGFGIPVIRPDGRQIYMNAHTAIKYVKWVVDIDLSDPENPTYQYSEHSDPRLVDDTGYDETTWVLGAYDYKGNEIVTAWGESPDKNTETKDFMRVRYGCPADGPNGGHFLEENNRQSELLHLDLRNDLVLTRYEGVRGVSYDLHYNGETENLYQSSKVHHSEDTLYGIFVLDVFRTPLTGQGVAIDGQGRLFLSLICTDTNYLDTPYTWERAKDANVEVVNIVGETSPRAFTRTPATEDDAFVLFPLQAYALSKDDPLKGVVSERAPNKINPKSQQE